MTNDLKRQEKGGLNAWWFGRRLCVLFSLVYHSQTREHLFLFTEIKGDLLKRIMYFIHGNKNRFSFKKKRILSQNVLHYWLNPLTLRWSCRFHLHFLLKCLPKWKAKSKAIKIECHNQEASVCLWNEFPASDMTAFQRMINLRNMTSSRFRAHFALSWQRDLLRYFNF